MTPNTCSWSVRCTTRHCSTLSLCSFNIRIWTFKPISHYCQQVLQAKEKCIEWRNPSNSPASWLWMLSSAGKDWGEHLPPQASLVLGNSLLPEEGNVCVKTSSMEHAAAQHPTWSLRAGLQASAPIKRGEISIWPCLCQQPAIRQPEKPPLLTPLSLPPPIKTQPPLASS